MSANDDSQVQEDRRLNSWKEIAAFFGKDERTVKRWEVQRGLPVHRLPGGSRTTVFAYAAELDVWLKGVSMTRARDIGEAIGAEPLPAGAAGFVSSAAGLRATRAMLAAFALLAAVLVFALWGVTNGLVDSPRASTSARTAIMHRSHVPAPEVHELYLTGIFHWDKRTPEGLNQAVHYFSQAIAQDPAYAEAYVGLANCYNLLREYTMMPAAEAYPRAKAAAERALALDDTLADAHTALAFVEFYWFRDMAKAERAFQRALELDPDSVRTHHWFGTALLHLGEFERSLAELTRARELDPESRSILADKGLVLFYAGRTDEAIALLTQLEASEPDYLSPSSYLAAIYFAKGDYEAYLAKARKAARLLGDQSRLAVIAASEAGFESGGAVGMLQAMLDAQRSLYAEGKEDAYNLARTYMLLGDVSRTISYLRTAVERLEQGILAMRIEPAFKGLRTNADFRRLLDDVGLPPLT